jgi:HEAT repeat protein
MCGWRVSCLVLALFLARPFPAVAAFADEEPVYRGKPLSQWIKALQDKDPLAKLEALNVLGQAGPPARAAVPALIGVFRDKDATFLFLHPLAAVALARIGPTAVPALEEALKDPASLVRGGAALALGMMGPDAKPAVPGLAGLLKDREMLVRNVAASALGDIGPGAKEALPALQAALTDESATVRVEAGAALWKIGRRSREAVPVLAAVLQDKNADVIRRAVVVLGEIGPEAKSAVSALRPLLRSPASLTRVRVADALAKIERQPEAVLPVLTEGLRDPEAVVRTEGARALTALGTAARPAAQALRRALTDPEFAVRWWAAVALLASDGVTRAIENDVAAVLRDGSERSAGGTSPPVSGVSGSAAAQVIGPLTKALAGRGTRLRQEAARALGDFGADAGSAIPALVKALEDEEEPFARAVSDTLARIGPQALPALRKAATTDHPRVRAGAFRALGRLGAAAREEAALLRKGLKDRDPTVRAEAAVALWRIEGKTDEGMPILLQDLQNKDLAERWPVARALGILGSAAKTPDPDVTAALVGVLKEGDARLRVHAVKALWEMNRQVRLTIPLLQPTLRDPDELVRLTALEVLGDMGSEPPVLGLLREAFKDKALPVLVAATEAAARIGSEAVPLLIEALRHENPRVRAAAAEALGRIDPPAKAASKALLEAARDRDERVRGPAIRALQAIRPDDAADWLRIGQELGELEKKEKKPSNEPKK